MDGGCIGILRKNALSNAEWVRLKKYLDMARSVIPYFSVKAKKPEFKDLFVREQVITVFGQHPETEITICGFSDAIFPAAEDILRMFGGWLYIGLDPDIARKFTKHVIPIIMDLYDDFDDTEHIEINTRFLSDVVLVSQYFNSGGESLSKKIGFKM